MYDKNVLSNEEGYDLVCHYVQWYWTQKFYSLRETMEMEDCIGEVYLKLFNKDYFAQYNPAVTTKKYYVCCAVFRTMVDLLRKQKRTLTLNIVDYESGSSLVDLVEDEVDCIGAVESNHEFERILNQLPDNNTNIKGVLPDGSEVTMSFRTLAELLEKGYLAKDIAGMFKNPATGESLSSGTVSRHINAMRDYALDNILLF